MPYVGQKPADIIATAVDTTTGTFSGALDVKGAAVFNEDSADVDFRVESNANANMIFVDGGNNKVGINDDVPVGLLSIKGGDSGVTAAQGHANELVIENNTNGGITFNCGASNSATLLFQNSSNADDGAITYRNSEREFRFKTAGAEQVRIHSNGVLSASDGVALGVGTANTASNVLDDYEEGTWTPNIGGNASYTSQDGVYTKIGNMVHLQCKFQVNVRGTGSTAVLSGLPFASNNSWTSGSLSVSYYVSIATSMVWVSGYVHNNASTISFSGNSASATTIGHNGFAIFGNSARVDFQCSYRTA